MLVAMFVLFTVVACVFTLPDGQLLSVSNIQFRYDEEASMSSSIVSCWDGDMYTFDRCCSGTFDLTLFLHVLFRRAPLRGNSHCWDGDYSYDHCCSINYNLDRGTDYQQIVWQMLLPPSLGRLQASSDQKEVATAANGEDVRQKIFVVQGAVIANLQLFKGMPMDVGIPFFDLNVDGLLWGGSRAALALASVEFGFAVHPGRRLLEVAAGTGAPSLVALARGFTVVSTDISFDSGWQRQASAVRSFGPSSAEVKRFSNSALDLRNASTWPCRGQGPHFDVAVFVQVGGPEETHQLCGGFRRIVSRCLRLPGSVGLYMMNEALSRRHFMPDSSHFACMRPDRHHSVHLHQPLADGGWRSERLPSWDFEQKTVDIMVPHPTRHAIFSIEVLPGRE